MGSTSADGGATPAIRWWTWPTIIAFLATAAGFGVWIAFASEQADAENAGETVSAGVRTGVWVGGILLLTGLATLLAEHVRRGLQDGRLVLRVVGAIGQGLLALLAGFLVMMVVVHAAFG